MGLVAACALATGWMRNKVNSAPDHLRETASFWELVRHKSPPPLNREQRRARARAMVTAFMAEFPVLAVEARPVPPEVNGFLKLHELERSGLKIGPELETLLESGEASPDPETAWRLLEENAAWVAEIERIAAMEQRSSSNLPEDDVEHFPKALGFGGRMLLLKAWLAAMAGDEAEALRQVGLSVNLKRHLVWVESPNLMATIAVTDLDRHMVSLILGKLLPLIGPDADVAAWRKVVGFSEPSPAEIARLLRGEWHSTSEHLMFPMFFLDGIPDPEALARAITEAYAAAVARIAAGTLGDLAEGPIFPQTIGDLPSPDAVDSWVKSHLRAITSLALADAAFQLLELERGGMETSAALAAMAGDPVTGAPFHFNAGTRTLSMATDSQDRYDRVELPW